MSKLRITFRYWLREVLLQDPSCCTNSGHSDGHDTCTDCAPSATSVACSFPLKNFLLKKLSNWVAPARLKSAACWG
eukprot:9477641-Pyramimonas_sp.AAC.2